MKTFPNLVIEKKISIKVYFTHTQWELYNYQYASVVAGELNRELERCINEGKPVEETRRFMHSVMCANDEAGAFDTEPRAFLEQVLDQIYASSRTCEAMRTALNASQGESE